MPKFYFCYKSPINSVMKDRKSKEKERYGEQEVVSIHRLIFDILMCEMVITQHLYIVIEEVEIYSWCTIIERNILVSLLSSPTH